jgi:exonuclease III
VKEWIEVFDILTIQETKIDKSFPDSQFAINGYDLYRRDRKKEGGGIIVYVRKSVPKYRLRVRSENIESILMDIQVGQQHITLVCAYKPPSISNLMFANEMSTILDKAISNIPNVICLGNLNCDILHPLQNGKEGWA